MDKKFYRAKRFYPAAKPLYRPKGFYLYLSMSSLASFPVCALHVLPLTLNAEAKVVIIF
jgi:hypothetical protein